MHLCGHRPVLKSVSYMELTMASMQTGSVNAPSLSFRALSRSSLVCGKLMTLVSGPTKRHWYSASRLGRRMHTLKGLCGTPNFDDASLGVGTKAK